MNEDKHRNTQQEGVSSGLERRITEIENNLPTIIETQLSKALQSLMSNSSNKEKENVQRSTVGLENTVVDLERDQDSESCETENFTYRDKKQNFKIPTLKIELD